MGSTFSPFHFLLLQLTNSVSIVDTINFGSLVGGYAPAPGGGSAAAAAAIAASGFGSDGGMAGAGGAPVGMDDAYGNLAKLGGGDVNGGAAFGGSSGYVAPDLSAPTAGGDGPLLA